MMKKINWYEFLNWFSSLVINNINRIIRVDYLIVLNFVYKKILQKIDQKPMSLLKFFCFWILLCSCGDRDRPLTVWFYLCTTSSDIITWIEDMSATLFLRCFELGEYCRPEIPWFFRFSGILTIILLVFSSSKIILPDWKSFSFLWWLIFSGEKVKPVIPLLCMLGSSNLPLNLSYKYWEVYSHLLESNLA